MPESSRMSDPSGLIDLDTTFLPIGRMRQITRVTLVEGATIEGEIEMGPDHWVYPQHFPGDPVFPGTLMIEGAGQLLALWAWAQGARGYPRLARTRAEFHNPVGPGVPRLQVRADVQRKRHLFFGSVQVLSADTLVATIEAVLVVLTSR